MGFSISWMAFENLPKAEVLRVAGLRDIGVEEEVPEAPFQTAVLPNGWTVVFANDVMFAEPDASRRLSRDHAVLGCMVEEHAMVSMCSYYDRGELVWEVVHDPSSSLMVSGRPPLELAAIRERLSSKGATDGGDGFDVPIELAAAICGFRHDEDHPGWSTLTFTVAVPA